LEQTGTGTAEGIERLEGARWDRRRFLRTTVAAAAGATLAPAFRASAKGPVAPKVVIVGAGTAGLVCAYRLQEKGIVARVIEASTRVGGRMFSLRNFFPDNQMTELGGEYVDSDHKTMHRLAKELGLTMNDLSGDGKSGDEHAFFFNGRMVPVDAGFIDMFRPVAKAITADLKQMKVRGEVNLETPHAREIDRLSISEWFEKRGVTGLPVSILRAAYVGEYGLEIDEQSSLNLLVTMGDDTQDDEFRPFGESDERFHIAEGNDAVPTRLAEKLQQPVELGVHLESIANRDRGFRLGFRTDGGSREETADIVVLALPFTILRRIDVSVRLPEAKRKAIKESGRNRGHIHFPAVSIPVLLGDDQWKMRRHVTHEEKEGFVGGALLR
jgi:monoamine oxidase